MEQRCVATPIFFRRLLSAVPSVSVQAHSISTQLFIQLSFGFSSSSFAGREGNAILLTPGLDIAKPFKSKYFESRARKIHQID